jgi:hypothetical protein
VISKYRILATEPTNRKFNNVPFSESIASLLFREIRFGVVKNLQDGVAIVG